MESTKRVFRFLSYGVIKSVGIFWLVILLVNIFLSVLGFYSVNSLNIGPLLRHNSSISFAGANLMSIFIFLIIYGIVMYHEDFALALSFGVTRKDFYKSVIVNNMLVVIIFAVIQSILQILDRYIIESLGYKAMVDFGLFNLEKDSILYIILVSATFYLTILSITNLIGVLQYRLGYKFWIGFGVIAITLQIAANIFGRISVGLTNIYNSLWAIFHSSTTVVLAFIIIIISYILGYVFIRKANIRK